MNLIKRLDLLRRGVEALERIAKALELQLLFSRTSEKGLFSLESSPDIKSGGFLDQSEEDFMKIEEEEKRHPDLVKQEEFLAKFGR